ncbi:MAG TPA: lysylphosphatidylglycerol synthase domain-containing protein [Gemmatimonadales bacterium]|nr:lysylphosphatidylglycerol synthase domain-containing protein [Gemmatimonadales bacterium]
MTTRTKRVLRAAGQILVLGGALWFLVRTARPHWGTLTSLPQPIAWGPLLLGSLLWLASYVLLVLLWAESLRWWGARLGRTDALRVFLVANLARYIPGGIWQFAGLAALALEHGVSPAAATGAVLVQQLVLLATGLVLALVCAPSFLGAQAAALPPVVAALCGAAALALLMVVFPWLLPLIKRRLERVTQRTLPLPHASPAGFAVFVAGSALGWVGYGASFWLFGRALLGEGAPGPVMAGSAFVASYVAGIIAVFAPGGLVVREAAIVAALGPRIGPQHALLLAVGSRLWLTVLELCATVAALAGQGLRSTNTN